MIRIPCLPTMWSQNKSIKIPLLPPRIQTRHVGEQVINIITVRGILFRGPLFWGREFAIETSFDFGFVVNGVEANHPLEEDVQFRVSGRVFCYFEEGLEDV